MIDTALFLRFCDDVLDQMAASATALGDDLVNECPPLAGANSAYGLVTHCLGVMRWWSRSVNLGLEVERDRALEFEATGTLADLLAALEVGRAAFHEDVARMELGDRPIRPDDEFREDRWYQGSQGGVLMHVYEELAQHCGHLDVTRDVLLGGS